MDMSYSIFREKISLSTFQPSFFQAALSPRPIRDFFYKEYSKHGVWHRKVLTDLIVEIRSQRSLDIRTRYNQRLSAIDVPCLIMWGDEDSFFPVETAHLMKQWIPQAELHIFSGVGHSPQIEVPRQFAYVVDLYLKKQCLQLEIEARQTSFKIGKDAAIGLDPDLRQRQHKAKKKIFASR